MLLFGLCLRLILADYAKMTKRAFQGLKMAYLTREQLNHLFLARSIISISQPKYNGRNLHEPFAPLCAATSIISISQPKFNSRTFHQIYVISTMVPLEFCSNPSFLRHEQKAFVQYSKFYNYVKRDY